MNNNIEIEIKKGIENCLKKDNSTLALRNFAIKLNKDGISKEVIKEEFSKFYIKDQENLEEVGDVLDMIVGYYSGYNLDLKEFLDKPRIHVDFNEMLEPDLVLLSRLDCEKDSECDLVKFKEGVKVYIYDRDLDENNNVDNLVAEGIVEKNKFYQSAEHWSKEAKWCCRISEKGIMHESDL